MKTPLFFILLSLSFVLQAQQDWDLFPLEQRSYIQVEDQLLMHYSDSTEQLSNGERLHHLGIKYYALPFDSCQEEIRFLASEDPDYPPEYFNPYPDTLYSNADYFYQTIEGKEVPFYHLSQLQDSWEVPTWNGSTLVCTVDHYDTLRINGYVDSIKVIKLQVQQNGMDVFHPLNDFEFKLGKTLGLIQWVALKDLYFLNKDFYTRTLFSFEKYGIAYGFTGKFTDFIHPEVGEVYKYRFYSYAGGDNGPGQETRRLDRDSITNVWRNDSTIYAEFLRDSKITYIYANGSEETNFEYNIKDTALYKDEPNLLYKFPPNFPVIDYYNIHSDGYIELSASAHSLSIMNNKHIIHHVNGYLELIGQLDICHLEAIEYPNNSKRKMHSLFGFYSASGGVAEYGIGGYNYRLIGFKSADGEEYQDTGIISTTKDFEFSKPFINIFPNPIENQLHLQLLNNRLENAEAKIFDLQGRLIHQQQLSSSSIILNTKKWLSGVYILKITTSDFTTISYKLIKK